MARRSGATYSAFNSPVLNLACTLDLSADVKVLLTKPAGTPVASRASTWSFISAMSGETTSVSPSKQSAGS